ncbi:MAG: hypothetical protein HFJ05_04730 [Eubacterium sp.]|nr:hypothetical protein [Eubacterium sp.]
MSRKVREEEKNILHILEERIPEERVTQAVQMKRRIHFSEETYEVIEKSNIFISDEINGTCIALIRYGGTVHICMKTDLFTAGILKAESEIENKDLLYGIGVLLANRKIVKIKAQISGYQIYDTLFAFENYIFSCRDVFGMFEEYLVFELTEEDFSIEYHEDLNRILCMLLINQRSDVYGSKFCQDIFELLTLESSRSIIAMFGAILQTTNADLIFLQLYRCIEYLFIIQKALYLSREYGIVIERILELLNFENIRFPEASSIRSILSVYCSETIINQYYDYLLKNMNKQQCKEGNKAEKVADYIYETRCKIAHFKYGQEKLKDNDTLNESNGILCEVVKNIFQTLDAEIVEINEKLQTWNGIGK